MTYNTIPIPHFSFTVVPEQEAKKLVSYYFSANTTFHIDIDLVKREVNNSLIDQDNDDDCIVILSYLINVVTEKVNSINEKYTVEFYTQVLHFLYRKIQTYGIEIPNDVFDKYSYDNAQLILTKIDLFLEDVKKDNPEKEDIISTIQEDVKKTGKKFLYLGKEDWAKMVLSSLITAFIKDGIVPNIPIAIESIVEIFKNFTKGILM